MCLLPLLLRQVVEGQSMSANSWNPCCSGIPMLEKRWDPWVLLSQGVSSRCSPLHVNKGPRIGQMPLARAHEQMGSGEQKVGKFSACAAIVT
jgi:hypothetical protein